jgi:cell division protein FtsB
MENLTPGEIITAILAAASAILLLSNAIEKIVHAVKAAKAPNAQQNARLDALEEWKRDVDRKLTNDRRHLDAIDEGARVTQRALIALLEHGIDGNNIKQMQDAKTELQNHLINR